MCRRSIPARAGEPGCSPATCGRAWVYPRACGGTSRACGGGTTGLGLSPRVRGNLVGRGLEAADHGSIPARAGEPSFRPRAVGRETVYPRACEGTRETCASNSRRMGLSPRVRGNLQLIDYEFDAKRSIPARAGEPRQVGHPAADGAVYPRACGGTLARALYFTLAYGLSPRVRGNRNGKEGGTGSGRSIPARAGEPPKPTRYSPAHRVYPRACGGTSSMGRTCSIKTGLSPRVRGNLVDVHHASSGDGSIPARAGEPPLTGLDRGVYAVYPRACGGTFANITNMAQGDGLSPRVRGNRNEVRRARHHGRSIPARAGEPQRHCVR